MYACINIIQIYKYNISLRAVTKTCLFIFYFVSGHILTSLSLYCNICPPEPLQQLSQTHAQIAPTHKEPPSLEFQKCA